MIPLFEQETQLLPLALFHHEQETSQQRYQRLKAFSDVTGMRLLFVYRLDEKIRMREQSTWRPPTSRM